MLNVQNNTGLGTIAGGVTVGSGGTLALQGGITIGAETLALNGTGFGSLGALRNISGGNSYGGLITLGSASRINSDAGTLSLTNTGTITGLFGLTFGGDGNTTVNSIIGSQITTLDKDGAGTVTLAGANAYTNATTISGGALRASNALALGASTAGTIVTNSGTLELQGGITIAAEALSLNTTDASATVAALRNVSGNNVYSGAITVNTINRIDSDSGTLTLSSFANNLGGTGTRALYVGGSGNTIFTGAMSNSTAFLTKDGSGTLTLSNNFVLTGAGTLTVADGTLRLGLNNAITNTSTSSSLRVTGANAVLDMGANSSTVGFVTLSNGSITSSTGILTASNSFTVENGSISAILAGSTATLLKTNAGTVTLSGANTYAGATTITNGALNVQNNTGLGTTAAGTTVASGAALELQGGLSIGAETLALNGTGVSSGGALRNISGNNTYGGLITLGSASRINSDSGTLSLTNAGTITGATFGLTLGGAGNINLASIIGTTTGTLTKDGAGTLTLTAANTYTGATTVSEGTLRASNASALGTNAATVANGATLAIAAAVSKNNIANNGTVSIQAGGNLTANSLGANSTGALVLAGSGGNQATFTDIAVAGASNSSTVFNVGAVTLTGNATIAFQNAYNTITSSGAVSISGSGNLLSFAGSWNGGATYNLLTGNSLSASGISLTNSGWTNSVGLGSSYTNGRTTYLFNTNATALFMTLGGGAGNITWNTNNGQWNYDLATTPWTNNLGGTPSAFYIGDNVTLSTTGSIITVTNTGVSAGTVTSSAASGTVTLTGGALTNTGLTKSGNGTLVLSNNVAVSGAESVSAGALTIAAAATNTASSLNLSGGAINVSGTVIVTSAETVSGGTLTVNAGGTNSVGSLVLSGGTLTGLGVLTNASVYDIRSGTANIALNGTSGLNKTTAGTVTLGATNLYSGTTTVSEGTLRYGTNNALPDAGAVIVSGGTLDIVGFSDTVGAVTLSNGSITGTTGVLTGTSYAVENGSISAILAGAVTLVKTNAGTVTLSGANTYTGATTITNGVLSVQNSAGLGAATVGTTVGSSAALELQGNITVGAEALTLSGTGISSGGALRNVSGNNTFGGLITLGAASRINSDAGTLTLTNAGTITGSDLALTFGGAGNITVNSIIGTGIGTVSMDGAGTLILNGISTYGGVTTIGSGVLQVTNLANAGTSSSLGTNGTIVIRNGGVLDYAGGTNSSMNRVINLAGGNGVIGVSNAAVALTSAGAITNNGNFVKTGAGTLVLSVSNSFTGTTTISSGVLSLANASALSGSTLDYSGAGRVAFSNLTAVNLGGLQGSTNLALTNASGAALVLNVGGNNSSTTYSGSLSGGGRLTKTGNGTLTLAGSNTQSGGTLISQGTLQIGSGGTSGSLATAVTNNGTLAFNRSDDITQSTAISGSGSLVKLGAGTLYLAASNGYTGATTISGGALSISNPTGVAGTSGVNIGDGASLNYTGGATNINRDISVTSGTGTIRNTGGGTLTLSGPLSKNGTTLALSGGNFDITGIISGAASNSDLIVDGATVTLNNTNTYNGATYIRNAGALVANVLGAMPTNTRSAVVMDDTGTGGSALTNAASQQIASLTGAASSSVNFDGSTLTIGTASGSTIFAGAMTGSDFVKDGASTQTLSGSLDATTLRVDGGLFSVTDSGRVGTSSAKIEGGSASVSGLDASWSNVLDIYIGENGSGNSLVISDRATVTSDYGLMIGYNPGSSTNSLVVTSGAHMIVALDLRVSYDANSGNTMTISDGAYVSSTFGAIGSGSELSVDNSVLVTGTNSQWIVFANSDKDTGDLRVGNEGSRNNLVISNGASVQAGNSCFVGYYAGSSSNTILVTGTDSLLYTANNLLVSDDANTGNRLIISNGGIVSVNGRLAVADLDNGNSNSILVTGTYSRLQVASDLRVSAAANTGNTVTVADGARVSSGSGFIGSGSASSSSNSGLVTGAGSVWSNSSGLIIGDFGSSNSLVISNGGAVMAQRLSVGYNAGASGNRLLVTGLNSSLSLAEYLAVSLDANTGNTMTIADGATVSNQTGYIGADSSLSSNNSVLVTGAGSTWTNGREFYVGRDGHDNSLAISNGGLVAAASNSFIGFLTNASNNSVLVSGTDSEWRNRSNLYVGYDGSSNRLTISGGGYVAVGSNCYIGSETNSSENSILVTGIGSMLSVTNMLVVSDDANSGNTLTVTNGARVTSGSGSIGSYSVLSSNNSVLVTGAGSSWSNSGAITIGDAGTGNSLTAANGGAVAASSITIAAQSNSSGALNLGGFGSNDAAGTISATTIAFGDGAGSINFNQSNNAILASDISGAGAVSQRGSGQTTLSGSNSFTGQVTVEAGTLELASLSGSAAGEVTNVEVSSGARLLISRSGQVNDDATITLSGGTIARGSGVSEIFGNLSLTQASFLDFGTGTAGTMTFGTYASSALLTINNFGLGNTLLFGSNLETTINNTSLFQFSGGFTSDWNGSTFTITAIPETSTYVAALGLMALLLWPLRRRLVVANQAAKSRNGRAA
ncbi:MAG: autotransporter-associated beta strand repeat-containing protein [Chthoniobacterales bacterium]